MQKSGLIIGVIVIILIAVGGYMFLGKSKTPLSTGQDQQGNVITSIRDALSKSVSLKCEYADQDGRKTVAYIKNGAVRADITSQDANEAGSVIVKDKKIYFWNAQGGFMMEVPDVTPEPGTAKTEGMQGQDVIENLEQYKESCKAQVVSDSLFNLPGNVKFQDFSKMFQMPTSTNSNSAQPTIDPKQYEELMKQYSNPQE